MQLEKIFFPSPEPSGNKGRIWPVFLPYQGCPARCIYCAQHLQTATEYRNLDSCFQKLHSELEEAYNKQTKPLELGFFGGTFTALPGEWALRFLDLVQDFRKKGLITKIRCSTRPDSLAADSLQEFRVHGLDLVELGVQSFSDHVLALSGRDYTRDQILKASTLVKQTGLQVGIQLLPGLPGHNFSLWKQDIVQTCMLKPALVRIYPCLVLKGTALARLWEKGQYKPWSLKTTIYALCQGVQSLWKQNIPVIRMGLPPEQALLSHTLAGPWHPALGNLVKSLVLFDVLHYHAALLGPGPKRLFLPQKHRGELAGHQGQLIPKLKGLGLAPENIATWKYPIFMLKLIA